MFARLDKSTRERTLRSENTFRPLVTGEYGYMPNTYYPNNIVFTFENIQKKPDKIYYVEFPNVDNSDALEMFSKFYNTEKVTIYQNWGYEIAVRIMSLRK